MFARIARGIGNQQGISTVETALMLPVFMVLFLGVVDFSRLYWTRHVVAGAAAEGARLAVLAEPTDADVTTLILDLVRDGGVKDQASVSLSPRQPGEPVTVSVAVPFEFLPLTRTMASLAGVTGVSASSVMVHER